MTDTLSDRPPVARADSGPFHSISRENNMMVVRYYLSFCVLIAHTAVLTGLDLPWFQRGTVDVGCFFAISGFLMFPSFQKRPTLRHYISRRARRILPPYVLIVLLCALSFCLVSTLNVKDYFLNAGFWKYLAANLSFLNWLHTDLPGVFTGPQFVTSAVNGSLWTMKGEWVCYLSVPLVFRLVKRYPSKGGLIIGAITAVSIAARWWLLVLYERDGNTLHEILSRQFGTLLVFFYIGAFVNFYFESFMRHKWWVLAFDVCVLVFADNIPFYRDLLQPIVAGTLVIWVSMVGKWGTKLSKHDSVSYDIYLFHFPIIQLAVLWGLPNILPPYAVLGVVVAVSVAFAFTSWNLIGRPFAKGGRHRAPKTQG